MGRNLVGKERNPTDRWSMTQIALKCNDDLLSSLTVMSSQSVEKRDVVVCLMSLLPSSLNHMWGYHLWREMALPSAKKSIVHCSVSWIYRDISRHDSFRCRHIFHQTLLIMECFMTSHNKQYSWLVCRSCLGTQLTHSFLVVCSRFDNKTSFFHSFVCNDHHPNNSCFTTDNKNVCWCRCWERERVSLHDIIISTIWTTEVHNDDCLTNYFFAFMFMSSVASTSPWESSSRQ